MLYQSDESLCHTLGIIGARALLSFLGISFTSQTPQALARLEVSKGGKHSHDSDADSIADYMASRKTHFGTYRQEQIKSHGPWQRFKQRFRLRFKQRSGNASLLPARYQQGARLEISPQKWLVRFVRICVGSLSAMGDKNRLPGVNFLHDAGTGEEEMIELMLRICKQVHL